MKWNRATAGSRDGLWVMVLGVLLLGVVASDIGVSAEEIVLVQDVDSRARGSHPAARLASDGVAYFTAVSHVYGNELYRSDGLGIGPWARCR